MNITWSLLVYTKIAEFLILMLILFHIFFIIKWWKHGTLLCPVEKVKQMNWKIGLINFLTTFEYLRHAVKVGSAATYFQMRHIRYACIFVYLPCLSLSLTYLQVLSWFKCIAYSAFALWFKKSLYSDLRVKIWFFFLVVQGRTHRGGQCECVMCICWVGVSLKPFFMTAWSKNLPPVSFSKFVQKNTRNSFESFGWFLRWFAPYSVA